MGKQSKRKKKLGGTKRTPTQGPWGFDYGLSVRVVALGAFDFNQKLRDAEIIAVAYGTQYSRAFNAHIPAFTLVGRHEAPLRAAFDDFADWASVSDADAIDVTVIFQKSGGYRFVISADPESQMAHMLRNDEVAEPVSLQVSWIKQIDSVSKPLLDLREYLEKGIRPFILSAGVYVGAEKPKPGMAPTNQIKSITGIKDLLKFKISFLDEGSISPHDWHGIGLMSGRPEKKRRSSERGPRLPPAGVLFSTREHRLKVLFPVTLWRAENTSHWKALCVASEQRGLRPWQVKQALCNVIVSREIGNGAIHFAGISKNEWPSALVTRLRQRYELADGKVRDYLITPDDILRQALLDSRQLLEEYGCKPSPKEFEAVQAALRKRNLLEGSDDL